MNTLNTQNTNNGTNGNQVAAQTGVKIVPVTVAKNATSTAPAHHLRDVITRLRDKWGNRLPWFFAYHTPTVSGKVLNDTAMRQVLEVIREQSPFLAAELEHFYDERLVQASHILNQLRESEDAKLAAERVQVQALNQAVDEAVATAKSEGAKRLAVLESPIAAAHRAAGEAVATIGGVYNPESPDADCVLGRVTRQDSAAVAGELRLPHPGMESKPLFWTAIKHAMTVTVGLLLGTSIGLASHLLPAAILKNPDLIGTYAVPTVLFLAGGIAVAAGSKQAIYELSRQAGKRFWLGRSAGEWAPAGVAAIALTAGIIYLDACVEREGLMAGVRIQQALQGTTQTDTAKEGFYLLLGMIIVIGYAIAALLEGYASGQCEACHLVITAEVEKRFLVADTAWRAKPEVQKALATIASVRTLLDDRGHVEAQNATLIADAEEKRRPEPVELSEDARRRIQESHDQFVAAQDKFDALVEAAKEECGLKHVSPWTGFARLFGVRPAAERTRKREDRKRL